VSDLQSSFEAVPSIVSGFAAVCQMTFLDMERSKFPASLPVAGFVAE
jgi:hypothetical protein